MLAEQEWGWAGTTVDRGGREGLDGQVGHLCSGLQVVEPQKAPEHRRWSGIFVVRHNWF